MTAPDYARSVLKQIADWQLAAASFKKFTALKDGTYSGRDVHGQPYTVTELEVDDWNRRLARLTKEAAARIVAADEDWFYWLTEYARGIAETWFEDFDERFGPAIEATARRRSQSKTAAAKGGKAKAASGRAGGIVGAARKYRGKPRNRASVLARKFNCKATHVRDVLRKAKV